MRRSVVNWAEARPEFVRFLARFEPAHRVETKDEVNYGLPHWEIDGFVEDVLYLTVNYDAIRRRTEFHVIIVATISSMLLLNCLYKGQDPKPPPGEGENVAKIEYARQKMNLEFHSTNPKYYRARALIGKLSYLQYLQGTGYLAVASAAASSSTRLQPAESTAGKTSPLPDVMPSARPGSTVRCRRVASQSVLRPLAAAARNNSGKAIARARSLRRIREPVEQPRIQRASEGSVGKIVEHHFESMSKNHNYSKTSTDWGTPLGSWSLKRGARQTNFKSVTSEHFFPVFRDIMTHRESGTT